MNEQSSCTVAGCPCMKAGPDAEDQAWMNAPMGELSETIDVRPDPLPWLIVAGFGLVNTILLAAVVLTK